MRKHFNSITVWLVLCLTLVGLLAYSIQVYAESKEQQRSEGGCPFLKALGSSCEETKAGNSEAEQKDKNTCKKKCKGACCEACKAEDCCKTDKCKKSDTIKSETSKCCDKCTCKNCKCKTCSCKQANANITPSLNCSNQGCKCGNTCYCGSLCKC